MARILLSDTHDWELVNKDEDLRGWEVRDARGTPIGEVGDLIVDTDTERIETVVLKDGATFRAADVRLADRVVYVDSYNAPVGARLYDDASLRRRAAVPPIAQDAAPEAPLATAPPAAPPFAAVPPPAPATEAPAGPAGGGAGAYADYDDDFRAHYRSSYGEGGLDYAEYAPAYRFGYDMAYDARYMGRDETAAEADLRAEYYRRYGYPMSDNVVWHSVRGAVLHAYRRARD